jgi:hypothetical protein
MGNLFSPSQADTSAGVTTVVGHTETAAGRHMLNTQAFGEYATLTDFTANLFRTKKGSFRRHEM